MAHIVRVYGLAAQRDRACGRLDQAQQRLAHGGFAAARFAHQRQRAAGLDRQRHLVHRAHMADRALEEAASNREMHFQPINLQQRLRGLFRLRMGSHLALAARRQLGRQMAAYPLAIQCLPVR